jgi:small subunit ribosomal protein S4
MKKRRPLRRRFRNVFYSKQQLRAFYGKQKEEAFRNFFKRFIGGAKGRNNMFAAALERRTDVFLFRLRFLPTIYACHQFIHHFGVDINGKKEKSPYALICPGDIVTFDKTQ